MSERGSASGEVRTRTVGTLTGGPRSQLSWVCQVDHVYYSEPCEHGHVDHGGVGLAVAMRPGGGPEDAVSVVMEPEEALLLADRITRAARIVLRETEEPADVEHEMLVAARPDAHE
jgi:hypothetical protein